MINKKNKKVLGVSILEALVSTVIIGIGFVAILQMTNYSVQSMQTSGDRTKANYLTNVIAEDVISSRRETTRSRYRPTKRWRGVISSVYADKPCWWFGHSGNRRATLRKKPTLKGC